MPTPTIMLRGLTPMTNEAMLRESLHGFQIRSVRVIFDRDTGDSKCFAFCDFDSASEAKVFTDTYAGSCGEPHGRSFKVDGRVVSIQFSDPKPHSVRKDWICNQCNIQNFARRTQCFKCFAEKTDQCQMVMDDFRGGRDHGRVRTGTARQPCQILVVRNLGAATEAEIEAAFRAFAPVKAVKINCDQSTGESRGFAFVEFHTVQEATHVSAGITGLRIGGRTVNVAYASKSMLHERPAWARAVTERAAAVQTSSQVQEYVKKLKLKKNSSPWPMPFEEAGGSYTFDQASQLYFEEAHGFYYSADTNQYFDGNKRIWYTFDTATRQFVVSDGGGTMSAFNLGMSPQSTPPSQWQELVDPSTSKKYYYNAASQESSWTPPSGFGAPPRSQQNIVSTTVVQKPQTFGLQGPRGMKRGLVANQINTSTRYAFGGSQIEEHSEEMKQVLQRQAQRAAGIQARTSLSDSQRDAQAKARMQETHAKRVRAEIERKAKEEKKFLAVEQKRRDLEQRLAAKNAAINQQLMAMKAKVTASTTPTASASEGKKPVCWVCRRGFKTWETLEKHKAQSALHKKNVLLATKSKNK